MKKYTILFLLLLVIAKTYAQNIGIGTNTPIARLDVHSADIFTARFNGPNQMYVGFYELANLRGYLGSYSGATEDFDIGTSTSNTNGKFHFTIQASPKMTIDNAGNVGIGTTSPSALLDLSSTSKGFLTPRMTSAQRTAITAPATGLMVYDITTGSFWYYNGSTWTNMVGGGGLTLPFSANVNIASPVFQIENSGNGDVLYIGNLGSGSGLNTYTLSGHAIAANSSSGYGVRATSFSNYALLALSDNAANTLAAIRAQNIGGGTGLHASSTADNGVLGTSSANSKSGIRGEATGTGGIGVYGNSTSATGAGLLGNNTAGGAGVYGYSTTGYGVQGITTSGLGFAGVRGTNNGTAGSGVMGVSNAINTIGVVGTSASGIGVRGTSSTGTGVQATSTSGLALDVTGNLKIAGGNTSPSDGAVLTSDASGNAVWKKNKIAFTASIANLNPGYYNVPDETEWKVLFDEVKYDYGSNFDIYTGGVPTTDDGTFTVPVAGLYHFDIFIKSAVSALNDFEETYVVLRMQRGVTITDLEKRYGTAIVIPTVTTIDKVSNIISTDVRLQAGDKLWVMYYQNSDLGGSSLINGDAQRFSGHLVLAD